MTQIKKDSYHPSCEYCDGTVKERMIRREMFRVKDKFVILEDVPVGVCDGCGTRYYHAYIVRRAHQIAQDESIANRRETVPVGHLS
jgi:YgiT-type zinc finger domain-containing protein